MTFYKGGVNGKPRAMTANGWQAVSGTGADDGQRKTSAGPITIRLGGPSSQREGKVLSSANEALLREAQRHLAAQAEAHAEVAQYHATAMAALGKLGAKSAQDEAVEACDRLLDAIRDRRCYRKYQTPQWDAVVAALEAINLTGQPPSVRLAKRQLRQLKEKVEPTFEGNVRFDANGVLHGRRKPDTVPNWRQSIARQMFAVRAARERRRKP